MAVAILGDQDLLDVDSAKAKFDIDSNGMGVVLSVSRVRWVLIAVTSGAFGVLAALVATSRLDSTSASFPGLGPRKESPAPVLPPPRGEIAVFVSDQSVVLEEDNGTTRSIAYSSVILDPRWIDLQFFGGWSREFEANEDGEALLFFTGPTFEKGHPQEPLGMVIHGDLKLSDQTVRAGNRAAAAGRAFIAIRHDGVLDFGFGSLTEQADQDYRLFIGGLHAFVHPFGSTPPGYKGVYGPMTMADVRIVYGLRDDGRLEVVETADGVFFPDLRRFVKAKGFVAAFLPDHASKSRLIVPGQRLWSEDQAVWVSGGKPSITALPFMLRVVARSQL